MSKVRVYEVAKQLGIDETSALTLLQSQGAPVRNRLSAVEQDVADRARRALERSKSASVVEERIRPTVVRRKATPKATPEPTMPVATAMPARGTNGHSHAVTAPFDGAPIAARDAAVARDLREALDREPREPRAERPSPPSATPPPETRETREVPSRVVPTESREAREQREKREDRTPVVADRSEQSERVDEDKSAPTVVAPLPSHAADEGIREVAREPEPPNAYAESMSVADSSPTPPAASARAVLPKTGIETWAGRPGVPMPAPTQTRSVVNARPGSVGTGTGPGGTMQRRGVQYDPRRDATPPGRPGMGQSGGARPGMGSRPMGTRGGMGTGGATGRSRPGMSGPSTLRRPTAPTTAEMAAHKKVIKIDEKVTLNTLAARMSLKATDVLMKLLGMGMTGVNINTTLDADTAKILASEFGWEVSDVAVSEETQLKEMRGEEEAPADLDRELRPPVVTVMGHVDHGKTSLLDFIRKTQVASGEAGGITQHIGAYKVQTSRGQITFLDTPGHEAFTQMRARGASVTDIVVLVVAADDGVMPQTREAVNHAKAAKVPIIVAVNKVDKPEADPQRPRRELMELELISEELGGDTMYVDVSAKSGQGIDQLLDAISLQAEVLELKANPKKPATGTVIEALLDRGKGPVARILVRDGTLNVGDVILAGSAYGKIRAMTDELGRVVHKAGPSTPVEVLGLSDVPNAGDRVDGVKDAKKAQELAEQRGAKEKKSLMPATAKVSLEDLARRVAESGQLELRLIIKADVQGSVEAVSDALQKLSTEKVKVTVVHSAVGAITEGDVNLAAASKAIIAGFNVRPAGKASSLSDTEGVQIRLYTIIYNALDDVKKAMQGLLAPTLVENFLGRAEVRQIFNITKVGVVAGCMVTEGTIKRTASKVRLVRDAVQVWEGKMAGLKHIKEDRKEVEKGFECGISLENYNDIKPADLIECYDVEEVAATL